MDNMVQNSTQSTAQNTESGFVKFLKVSKFLLIAIAGYIISWIGDNAIYGTVIAAGAAISCWLNKDGKPMCDKLAIKIVSTVIAGIAVIELFVYGVF